MRISGTIRGFSAGIVIGVLAGSAGMAAAAFGYKGWQAFSEDFKGGYVAGFLDMAKLARNLQPGGWVDDHYPYMPGVKALDWKTKIDELYKDPENQKFTIESILQLAGHDLAKTRGGVVTGEERQRAITQHRLEVLRQHQIDKLKAEGKPIPPELTSPPPPKEMTARPRVVKPAPKKRVWCRCDGKDPKALRAARKARREAEAAAKKDAATGADVTRPAPAANGKPDAAKAVPAENEAPVPADENRVH